MQDDGVRDGPEVRKGRRGKRRKGKKGKKRKSMADTELFYDSLVRALFFCFLCAFPLGNFPSFLTGFTRVQSLDPGLIERWEILFLLLWPTMLWFKLITRRPKVLIHLPFVIKLQCRCIQQEEV